MAAACAWASSGLLDYDGMPKACKTIRKKNKNDKVKTSIAFFFTSFYHFTWEMDINRTWTSTMDWGLKNHAFQEDKYIVSHIGISWCIYLYNILSISLSLSKNKHHQSKLWFSHEPVHLLVHSGQYRAVSKKRRQYIRKSVAWIPLLMLIAPLSKFIRFYLLEISLYNIIIHYINIYQPFWSLKGMSSIRFGRTWLKTLTGALQSSRPSPRQLSDVAGCFALWLWSWGYPRPKNGGSIRENHGKSYL